MESGYEKDPRDHEAFLGALHEQELRAPQDLRETQDRGVIQGLRRTQEAQDLWDHVETQDPEARRDQLDHVETQDRKASREIQDGQDSRETQDLSVRKASREIQDGQDRKGQEETDLRVTLVQRET